MAVLLCECRMSAVGAMSPRVFADEAQVGTSRARYCCLQRTDPGRHRGGFGAATDTSSHRYVLALISAPGTCGSLDAMTSQFHSSARSVASTSQRQLARTARNSALGSFCLLQCSRAELRDREVNGRHRLTELGVDVEDMGTHCSMRPIFVSLENAAGDIGVGMNDLGAELQIRD